MWFEDLFGFEESGGPEGVRARLTLRGGRIRSRVNGREYGCGRLETPSLGELRARVERLDPERLAGAARWSEVVGDIRTFHRDSRHTGAVFQAASQFNLLEMAGPRVTPEQGVGIYELDRTQGPACAISAGAGTVYRNYFVPLGDQIGQTAALQVDCLADVGRLLDNSGERLWKMRNGYALATEEGLREIGDRLAEASGREIEGLREALRVGVQWNVEVTLPGAGHPVTQVYGSALPVGYGSPEPHLWEPFARLVLEASYEATLLAAVLNAAETGNGRIFLTLLGGGVFGNRTDWILDAIERSATIVRGFELDVAIVSYGSPRPSVGELLSRIGSPA